MIKKKSVTDLIVESVVEQIKNGELKVGDKLPNEKTMAAEYGVSRVSLREALVTLAAKGLVDIKHGDGTYINDYNPEVITDVFYQFALLNNTAVFEMLEIRKVMESEAARLASINATEEEIKEIKEYKEAREHYYELSKYEKENIELKNEYDTKFHLAIARATHNYIFERFIEIMHRTLDIHQKSAASIEGGVNKTTYFHNEIYDAIASRDSDRAQKMMYMHLEQIENSIKQMIEKQNEKGNVKNIKVL